MSWLDTAINIGKTYVAAQDARDARKSAERIAALQNQAITDQETAAMRAYAALATPRPIVQSSPAAPYVSPVSSASALDPYLPMIVIGVVAVGAFAMFRR